jgi:hypothetical protein
MVQYARLGRPAEEAGQPEGHDQYAIRPGSDDAWVELATLGLQAADIGELVAASPEACARLSAGRGAAADPAAVLRCPVVRPSKMIAIGLNYMDHIRETGAAVPDSPISFAKYPNSLNDPFGGIVADPSLTATGIRVRLCLRQRRVSPRPAAGRPAAIAIQEPGHLLPDRALDHHRQRGT